MSFKGNNQNFKNVKKNAREQRLQFMNSQAELIAQKKREIEEKLAAKQQPAPSSETKAEIVKTLTAPVQQETANQLPHSAADEIKYIPIAFLLQSFCSSFWITVSLCLL